MTELERYLAEEVAEDHADGIITRREAVRRLGLLGVSGAAASTMLAAFGAGSAAPSSSREHSHRASRHGRSTAWAPVARKSITFPSLRPTPLTAAWAPAAKPLGGVLVIHENRGLNEHIRSVAGRFAASGWSALALDLLSEEGGTGSFPGEAEVAAALAAIAANNPQRFTDDMKAALGELQRRVGRKRLAAIGFCFGGGMVWNLLASGEPRLSAAAPFYGPFPTGGDLRGSRNAAVLGVYAGLDSRVNATRDAARAALEAARLRHEIVTFTEADHAFFNDTGARFNAPAAAQAWHRVLDWFGDFAAHGRGHNDHDSDSD